MSYSIEEHSHRLAAWEAARAASASPVCRFKVQVGVDVLEACGFETKLAKPSQLPIPGDVDNTHRQWCKEVIAAAKKHQRTFTHGIAAKLINSYLKARFVCGGFHEHKKVICLHPPVDRLLLNSLGTKNVGGFKKQWRHFEGVAWSKFNASQYQEVINLMRKSLSGRPLWQIEAYWRGYQ